MRNEDYDFIYHFNTECTTPSRKVAAMTISSVASYFNGEKGDYVTAKTRIEARDLLKAKLDGID